MDRLADGIGDIVLIPGLGGSPPGHWQWHWRQQAPERTRWVEQDDWDQPERRQWVRRLAAVIAASRPPVVLVAHSLGCITVAHWAARYPSAKVTSALLVAPADVEQSARLRERTRHFLPLPVTPLPIPARVVASRNDPYIQTHRARMLAQRWGAAFEDVGRLGHINLDSDIGAWPQGLEILADTLPRRRGSDASARATHQGPL